MAEILAKIFGRPTQPVARTIPRFDDELWNVCGIENEPAPNPTVVDIAATPNASKPDGDTPPVSTETPENGSPPERMTVSSKGDTDAVVQSEPKPPSRSTTHRRRQLQGFRDAIEAERLAREAAEAELSKATVELERLRATAVPIDSRLLGITFIGGVHSAEALRQLLLLPEDEFRRHMAAAMERQRIEKEILAMVALQQKTRS